MIDPFSPQTLVAGRDDAHAMFLDITSTDHLPLLPGSTSRVAVLYTSIHDAVYISQGGH